MEFKVRKWGRVSSVAFVTFGVSVAQCGVANDDGDNAADLPNPGEAKDDSLGRSTSTFRGFPPQRRPDPFEWIEERNEVWLGSDSPRRSATITVSDRGGGIGNVFGRMATGNEHRSNGILGDLVVALGGREEAARVGVREVKNFRNLYGFAAGADYKIDVEVDRRLTAADYASLGRDTHLVMPLSAAIVAALRARGNERVRNSAGGRAVWFLDGQVYLKVDKSGVMSLHSLE